METVKLHILGEKDMSHTYTYIYIYIFINIYFGIKAYIFPVPVSPREFPFVTVITLFIYAPQLLSKLLFNLTIFNYREIMTLMIQNKSVVIWLKTCQLQLGAAGLLSAALNSVLKVRPLDCRSTVRQTVSRSGTLEEKTNGMKILNERWELKLFTIRTRR